MFCIKFLINLSGRWFVQIMWVKIDPVVTPDARDVVITINNDRIKKTKSK